MLGRGFSGGTSGGASQDVGCTVLYTDTGNYAGIGNTQRTAYKLRVTPTSNCTLTSITIGIINTVNTSALAVTASVYSDGTGKPGSLVGTATEVMTSTTKDEVVWRTGTVSGNPSLTSGEQYWIVVEGSDNYASFAKSAYGDAATKNQTDVETGIVTYDWSAWGTSSATNSNFGYSAYFTCE